jgi:hypothetical protein
MRGVAQNPAAVQISVKAERVAADLHDVALVRRTLADVFDLLSGKEDLSTYTFNTRVAQHTFCRYCGMHPFCVPRSDPDKIDVNMRCLDGVDLTALQITRFDGQNWEAAMRAHVPWS